MTPRRRAVPAAGARKGAPRAARRRAPAKSPPPAAALPPLSLRHPAWLLGAAIAAACVVLAVTFHIDETDFWQHLLVGKVIWQGHGIPTTQIWTWPTYGAPDVNSSWGFEALVYPFQRWGGVAGLFAWRWLTTLAAFGLMWAAARRMGARGLSPLVALVLAALVYRQRSQIRPETLVAVLMGLEIWILETRRHGGPDRSLWIVPIAWVWANTHISYHVGFLILGIHVVASAIAVRRARAAQAAAPPGPAGLIRVGLAALAISFVNPFGWRALWQPFEYFLFWRHEPLYRLISELRPVDWSLNDRNGLAVLALAWPLLLLWRARRRGFDLVETAMCVCFTTFAVMAQRFLGFYALAAAPYLARDLDAWVSTRRWPRWSEPPLARAALSSAACVAILLPQWSLGDPPNGIGIEMRLYPVAACDFIAAHGVRGRGFNQFKSGGYLLWRFWPERDRLPFMDIHQAGTPEIRRLYVGALLGEEGWRALDGRFAFDWALLSRPAPPGDRMLDALDADTSWAMVFVDDAAALYVKRGGPLAAVADRFAYRTLAAGEARVNRLAVACATDSALRARVRAELEREIAASPATALAHSWLANLALAERRYEPARAELERALALDPHTPKAYERLATVALATGKPDEALAALARARAEGADPGRLDLGLAMAYQQLGQADRARAALRRVLKRDPGNELARAMMRQLEGGAARE